MHLSNIAVTVLVASVSSVVTVALTNSDSAQQTDTLEQASLHSTKTHVLPVYTDTVVQKKLLPDGSPSKYPGKLEEQNRKLINLTAQVEDLRRLLEDTQADVDRIDLTAVSNPVAQSGVEPPLSLPEKQVLDRQQTIQERQAAQLNFDIEDMDNAWATDMESQLQQVLTSAQSNGHSLANVECKSTMCRMEVVHQPGSDVGALGIDLAIKVSENLPATLSWKNESGNTIYLFAKNMASLKSNSQNN